MKKRLLALLLAGVMVLGLAACGGGQGGTAATPAPAPATPAGGETNTPDGNTDANKTIKVGLICIGDENDQGYTSNFIRGKEAAT